MKISNTSNKTKEQLKKESKEFRQNRKKARGKIWN